jgi:hypothetical protein
MKYLLIVFLALMGCSEKGEPDYDQEPPADLEAKNSLYKHLIQDHQDDNGFILSSHCDSLMFTSLMGIAIDESNIDITAARDDDGRWYRRPAKDCLSSGGSISTISKDMILGLMWYIWKHELLDEAQMLHDYIEDNNYVIGDHNGSVDGRSRVTMSPGILSTIAQIIYKLDGRNYSEKRRIPILWTTPRVGFESHLTALHLTLRREVYGHLSGNGAGVLKKLYDREPNNPLFAYSVGDYGKTMFILNNKVFYPSNRLPTSGDRCAGWLPERAEDDYAACPHSGKTHSGGDYLFIYALMFQD